ncbi:MAG: DMT family transporter, partial [Halobacteria archaeon]|nr:DMT family transporter [Halobacteria archaeon]
PIETMEAWSMVIGALVMHAISLAIPSESFGLIEWNAEAVGALFYLSIISSAFGFLIYFDLLERLGPVEINLVSYVAPIFAAISGWLWLNEVIDIYTVVGFVVIFLGFVIIKRQALASELPRIRALFSSRY